MSSTDQFLTKTRFKIGLECPTKLYYLSKAYSSSKNENEFLQVHADGGHQVGEYAKFVIKAKYPNHHFEDLSSDLNYPSCVDRTDDFLKQDKIIIAESAHVIDDFFIRVDLLVKTGSLIEIYEVKSKSISSKDSFLKEKNGITEVKKEWSPYIADIAFQYGIIKKDFSDKQFDFKAYMMLLDKDKPSNIDKLNQYFFLKKKNKRVDVELQKLSETEFLSNFKKELNDSLMTTIDVTDIVELIITPLKNQDSSGHFSDQLKFPFTNIKKSTPLRGFFFIAYYLAWLYKNKRKDSSQAYFDYVEEIGTSVTLNIKNSAKIFLEHNPQIDRVGSFCKNCEFKVSDQKSGFDECWFEEFPSYDPQKNHIFELWNYKKSQDFIDMGFHTLEEMNSNNFPTMNPNTKAFARQQLQIESSNGSSNIGDLINKESLQSKINSWKFPYHFIDFETCQVALPFHKNQKPFTMLATQFSCHSLNEDGSINHFEWIARQDNHDPSFECIEELYKVLGNDQGSIFMYSNYENYVLKSVKSRMEEFDKVHYSECILFLDSITFSPKENKPERALIDLKDIVLKHYYHPSMKGSNSLKAVLPAIMQSSPFLKEKYSEPLTFGENLSGQIFFKEENGMVLDPYKLLPKIKSDVASSNAYFGELLADGAAAMKAFQLIQFSDIISRKEKDNLIDALKNYCELDTLAMLMLFEHLNFLVQK